MKNDLEKVITTCHTCISTSLYKVFIMSFIKVPGATQAELTFEARRTQRYVCRVNDRFCNCKFSEWVIVEVLDVAKPGKKSFLFCKT